MRVNNRGTQDVRRVLSGKDAAVFSENGELLANCTQFQAQINVSNGTYNPLGSALTYKHLLSYEVTLTIQETIIESSRFLRDVYDYLMNGVPTMWTFRAVLFGWNGTGESIVFRDCVPDGQLDLMNATVGELWVRSWSLSVNSPPELQTLLVS